MKNIDFYNNINAEESDRVLVTNDEPVCLLDFMWTNLVEPDVNHILIEDAERVIKLQPGQSLFIELSEVRRIS